MPDINIKLSLNCSKWMPRFSSCCGKEKKFKDESIDKRVDESALKALKEPEENQPGKILEKTTPG